MTTTEPAPAPADAFAERLFGAVLESMDLISSAVSSDRRSANIQLRVDDNGSADLMRLADFP